MFREMMEKLYRDQEIKAALKPGSIPVKVEPVKTPAPVKMPEPVKEPVKV